RRRTLAEVNVELAAQLRGEPVVLRRVTPLAELRQAARHGSHAGYRERCADTERKEPIPSSALVQQLSDQGWELYVTRRQAVDARRRELGAVPGRPVASESQCGSALVAAVPLEKAYIGGGELRVGCTTTR